MTKTTGKVIGVWMTTVLTLAQLVLIGCKADGLTDVPWTLVFTPLWILFGLSVLGVVATLCMSIASSGDDRAGEAIIAMSLLVSTGTGLSSLAMLALRLDGRLMLPLLHVLAPPIAMCALLAVLTPVAACCRLVVGRPADI